MTLAQPLDAGRRSIRAAPDAPPHRSVTPVVLYRLLSRVQTRRLGLLSTVVLTAGTPLAFWASVPKRHAVTGTVVVCVAYCLYRSRKPADGEVITQRQTFRALAYALVGLYAWVHAPEALLLCVAQALVDIPSAPAQPPICCRTCTLRPLPGCRSGSTNIKAGPSAPTLARGGSRNQATEACLPRIRGAR